MKNCHNKKILYKISSMKRQNKYKAISAYDLNNPLNPPFLRGTSSPLFPDRNVGKDTLFRREL